MKLRDIWKLIIAELIVCLFLFSVVARAQGTNTISGFVFGLDRQPLPSLSVELQDEFYRSVSRAKTDGSGRYLFGRVSAGRYYIIVRTLGTSYDEQTAEVEIVNLTSNSGGRTVVSGTENVQKDFYLRDKRTTGGPTPARVVFAQNVPTAAKKLYENAEDDLRDAKKQLKGIEQLLAAIEIFPDYYEALEKLATEYIKLASYQKAADIAKRAVEVNPRSFSSWYSLGYSHFQLNHPEDALVALEKAISLSPLSVNALFVNGVNLRRLGRFAEAEESMLKAKKLAKVPVPEIHWQLALLYTNNLKRYADAIKELELFLKDSPNNEEVDKVNELIKKLRSKVIS